MNPWVWKQVMKHEGEPVLTLSLRRPQPPEGNRKLRRLEGYYLRLGEAWIRRWETVVYPRACAALEAARGESRPFDPWTAELTYTVTLETEGLLSLYLDAVERGSAPRPLTVRMGDTWDLRTGCPLTLPEVLSPRRGWRGRILEQVGAQAGERLAGGESLLFSDVGHRLVRHFSPRRFYCTKEGVVVFYPLQALGSAAEGLPLFPIPVK